LPSIRNEIKVLRDYIQNINDPNVQRVLQVILSRTVRTCRATTHADLATLIEPVRSVYYCAKHGKLCKPLFTTLYWWKRYSTDTIQRLATFQRLRTNTYQLCLAGDARNINIIDEAQKAFPVFGELIKRQKIQGIFTSPPYLG
jgi:hypothetical protein